MTHLPDVERKMGCSLARNGFAWKCEGKKRKKKGCAWQNGINLLPDLERNGMLSFPKWRRPWDELCLIWILCCFLFAAEQMGETGYEESALKLADVTIHPKESMESLESIKEFLTLVTEKNSKTLNNTCKVRSIFSLSSHSFSFFSFFSDSSSFLSSFFFFFLFLLSLSFQCFLNFLFFIIEHCTKEDYLHTGANVPSSKVRPFTLLPLPFSCC